MYTIQLYQTVGKGPGELSSKQFAALLSEAGGHDVDLRINSSGGEVLEGYAIGNLIAEYPGKVRAYVDGGALSIASYIAVRADELYVGQDSWIMIHNPMVDAMGDGTSLRKQADVLDSMRNQLVRAYAAKSSLDSDTIKGMMEQETWLDASQAVKQGFADGMSERSEPVNLAPEVMARWHVPQPVANSLKSEKVVTMSATIQQIENKCKGASAEFILEQVKANATLENVIAAYAKSKAEENEELLAKVAAIQAEHQATVAKLKAQIDELNQQIQAQPVSPAPEKEPEEEPKPDATVAEEEKKPDEMAVKAGAEAVAFVRQGAGGVSARNQWQQKLNEARNQYPTFDQSRLIVHVNKQNPGLREAMLLEVNPPKK